MDRHRGGGDRYYGGGTTNGDGSRPSRFSDGPSSSRFSDGAPSSRFSDGPPSSRFSDAPPPPNRYSNNGSGGYGRRSPSNFRSGSGGGRRAFDSPPRQGAVGGGFRPMGGDDGFRPMGGGFGSNYPGPPVHISPPLPLSGQKRSLGGRGSSPDRSDTGSFAKLFVGSVPRTATEGDIRPLFEEHGNVIEVALIKDKRTGQQQGCCFIKYATLEEADRAIKGLHNQHTLPGGVGPIQVRYADGERERLVEHKLFVGSLNKQATVKEVEEIFAPFGQVDDVYLMHDEMKQSRGCGFVKYSRRDMALAAINALNGTYRMRGCDQPLTVRFADPKRPRPGAGDLRGPPGPGPDPAFRGPGFGPRFQGPGPRLGPNFGDPMGDCVPSNAWNMMSPQNLGASAGPGPPHGFGNLFRPRPGDLAMPFNQGGGGPYDGVPPGSAISSAAQQGFNQPLSQVPPINQQISPVQKPLQSPQQLPSLQLHGQVASSYSQTQPSHAGQSPFNRPLHLQPSLGLSGQSTSQPQYQQGIQSTAAPQAPLNMNFHSHPGSSVTNQQPIPAPVQQQMLQPLQQSPSQLAQMLSQQTQTLQATFQSSQQAFSQLQQQLQMMQPSNQNLALQQTSQGAKQLWPAVPQVAANTPATMQPSDIPPSTSAPATTATNQIVAPVKCNWTEHTSPEGFKYYYNSITRESRWDKPEELSLFEKQQLQQQPKQNGPVQQPQNPSNPPVLPIQQASQSQQLQLQAQFRNQQLQQPSLSSMESSYAQLPVAAGTVNDTAHFQGPPPGQEWIWKNKPTGT